MNKKTTLDMTEGKGIRVLLVFTIPIFISNLFQQFYNVVDVAVIGHILGDNALAAVGATSSIYSLVIGFINGDDACADCRSATDLCTYRIYRCNCYRNIYEIFILECSILCGVEYFTYYEKLPSGIGK